MSATPDIDPATLCADCDKPWSEHWGFNCDDPYRLRKFKPLLPGRYPPNRQPLPHATRLTTRPDTDTYVATEIDIPRTDPS